MDLIHTVVLDVDDVCNQFAMNALQRVGATTHVLSYEDYPAECGWNIVDAANTLANPRHKGGFSRSGTYTVPQFWDSFDRSFWANLPPSPFLLSLTQVLERELGARNIIVATSPTICSECVAGKLEWIQRFLPPWLHRSYAITPRKELMAQPGVLLIDDRVENCERFVKRRGSALLVAQPWNKRNFGNSDTFTSLQEGLIKFLAVSI